MIVTVTLNAALDVTYVVEGGVRPGATHRVRAVAERAGGKGVNTARVLAILGEPVLALGLAGGASGAALREELDASGVPHRFTAIAGATRRTVAVVGGHGSTPAEVTGFWEPGPQVDAEEWERFVADFRTAVADARAVVLSGSLPPGVPRDAYARLVRVAAAAGVPTLVDADADALREALAAHPTLVKPNAEEALRALAADSAHAARAAAASGEPTEHTATRADAGTAAAEADAHAAQAPATSGKPTAHTATRADAATTTATLAERLVAAGARAAVVSAGAEGLVASWAGRVLAATPPKVVAGNATGAGDAASAALALALAHEAAPEDALVRAVALSAAAVAAPLAGDVDPDVLAELEPLVALRDLTN